MSPPEQRKSPQSKTVQICATVFVIVGIGGFQIVAPSLFPQPKGGGFNFERIMWAGVVGAIAGGIGAAVGKLIDGMRR
jgi:hypothetical protein